MRLIAVLIVATIVVYVLLGGFERDNTAAYAPMTQQQIAMAHQAALHSHYRGIVFWWAAVALFVFVVFGAAYRFLFVPAFNARERVPLDSSGMYPEVVRNVAPWWMWLIGERKLFIHNPNMVAAPHVYATLNGRMNVEAATDGASTAEQLEYARDSWSVQRTAAAIGGMGRSTVATMRAAAGVYDWQAKREQARTQLYQHRIALAQPPTVDPKSPPVLHATLTDALAGHTGYSIVLGQSVEDGELALWDPHADAHLGVWGKTGMGKTSRLGLTVALNQLRQNYRVIVIDPEYEDTAGGAWATIAPWAEVIGPGSPGCPMWDEIMAWYERRWATVQAAGATDAYHMPSGRPLRPLALHFDELSRWRTQTRQRGGAWAKYAGMVDDCLAEIAQRGRKRGVHLTIYGQLPGDLPEMLSSNLAPATFRLPIHHGIKVGHWRAHELSAGQFAFDGRVYNSWQPLHEAGTLLRSRQPVRGILSVRSTNGTVRGTFVNRSQPFAANDSRTLPPVANATNEGVSEAESAADILSAVYERSRSWDDVAIEFFAIYEDGTQAELRRIMAQIAADGRSPDAFKGEAHRLYHQYRGSNG